MGPIPQTAAAAAVVAGVLCCVALDALAAARASHGYALYSADALFEATANWQLLPASARRELLMELKARGATLPRARTERRYGYRMRDADGRVVTFERRESVTIGGAADGPPPRGHDAFGAGFERRNPEAVVRPASAPLGAGFVPAVAP